MDRYIRSNVRSALSTDSRGPGLCQSWVYHVYVNAGLPDVGFGTAYLAFKANCLSTDRNNIPIGAAVYATGSGSAGHVGMCWRHKWRWTRRCNG